MFRVARTSSLCALLAAAVLHWAAGVPLSELVADVRWAAAALQRVVAPDPPPAARAARDGEPAAGGAFTVALIDQRPGEAMRVTVWWLQAGGCTRPGVSALAADGSTYRHSIPIAAAEQCSFMSVRGVRFTRRIVGLVVSDGQHTRSVTMPRSAGLFRATIGDGPARVRRIASPLGEPGSSVFAESEAGGTAAVQWAFLSTEWKRDAVSLFDCLATGDTVCAAHRFARDPWGGPCEPCIGYPWAGWPEGSRRTQRG